MTQNKPLPGNDIALPEKTVRQILDDVIFHGMNAHSLVGVLHEYAQGNHMLLIRDPWNAGFWAMLDAIQDQMQKAVDGAESAFAGAAK